jgi:endo-1,4-beta-xylanase
MLRSLSISISFMLLLSCNNSNNAQSNTDTSKGLKDHYKNYFPIGVSVSPNSLHTDEADLIVKQFSSITPENAMKMRPIHPEENRYYWKDADSIVAFAKRNGLKIRGHALVWHQECPDWLFKDSKGNEASKELVLQRIKEHITTVVKRYKGTVYAWDVVNEAISDDKEVFYRQSKLYKICGDAFIAKAFEWAHAADPNAILFYNDYNEIDPVKRQKIISLIKTLRQKGIPVNAVGLQSHWNYNEPTKEQLEKTLADFAALKLPLQITELDISIYPKIHNEKEAKEPVDTTFTADKELKQAEQYKICFALFRKYRSTITGVTFWDVSDRYSWLDDFPVKNRKDHPLLFDKNLKAKKAFWQVVEFK